MQQRRLAEDSDRALLDTRNDVGTVHARRIVAELPPNSGRRTVVDYRH